MTQHPEASHGLRPSQLTGSRQPMGRGRSMHTCAGQAGRLAYPQRGQRAPHSTPTSQPARNTTRGHASASSRQRPAHRCTGRASTPLATRRATACAQHARPSPRCNPTQQQSGGAAGRSTASATPAAGRAAGRPRAGAAPRAHAQNRLVLRIMRINSSSLTSPSPSRSASSIISCARARASRLASPHSHEHTTHRLTRR